jgi:hypothetical protein
MWTLWYHDPSNNDYSLESYIRIFEVTTVAEFWSLIDGIPKDVWESGMFFFMKKGVPPVWDDPINENGGAWSKKIEASQAHTGFIDLMVHCLTDELLTKSKEVLVGLSISPKGQFHIIKIWNTETSISSKSLLNTNLTYYKVTDDVTYTSHKARPK